MGSGIYRPVYEQTCGDERGDLLSRISKRIGGIILAKGDIIDSPSDIV
jgi:hypothetical protein